jgi:hypothetical protein
MLSKDEARRIAVNIAKLPGPVAQGLRGANDTAVACRNRISVPAVAGGLRRQTASQEIELRLGINSEGNGAMSDPDRAGPELERRLAERVKVDGGIILVSPMTMDLFVLPVSTLWTLQCSLGGMSIVFGNSVTNEISRGETSEDFHSTTSNDVEVTLTVGTIDDKNCEVLAPRIGKRLLAILGGPDQRARQ